MSDAEEVETSEAQDVEKDDEKPKTKQKEVEVVDEVEEPDEPESKVYDPTNGESIVVMAWNKNRTRTEIDPDTGAATEVPVATAEKKFFTLRVKNSELSNSGIDFCFSYNRKLERMRKNNRASIIEIIPLEEAKARGVDRASMSPEDFFRKMNREERDVD